MYSGLSICPISELERDCPVTLHHFSVALLLPCVKRYARPVLDRDAPFGEHEVVTSTKAQVCQPMHGHEYKSRSKGCSTLRTRIIRLKLGIWKRPNKNKVAHEVVVLFVDPHAEILRSGAIAVLLCTSLSMMEEYHPVEQCSTESGVTGETMHRGRHTQTWHPFLLLYCILL